MIKPKTKTKGFMILKRHLTILNSLINLEDLKPAQMSDPISPLLLRNYMQEKMSSKIRNIKKKI